MTTVQNHIKELLFEQDCVVIPDFGGFVTNFDCAKVDPTNRFFAPPQKWLAFNSLLKNDDGLLSNFIAQEEGISREQANLKIKAFVEETKRYISFDNNYSIEGLGTFSQNEEGKVQFQPKTANNFFSESFGMDAIYLKKTDSSLQELQVIHTPQVASNSTIQQVFASNDREPMAEVVNESGTPTTVRKKGKFSRVLPAIYGLLGTAVLVTAVYLYDNPKVNLGSLNPFQSQNVENTIAKTEIVSPVKTTPKVDETIKAKPFENDVAKPVVEVEKAITVAEKRFFIITGSFGSKKNAQNLLYALKRNGFDDASLIFPKNGEKLIKVSAGGFANESEADAEAIKVVDAIHQSTWIYKK